MPLFDFFKEGPATGTTETETGTAEVAATETASPEAQVQAIIEELRPFLQADGGDCELVRVEDGVAHVKLVGACVGCPSSLMTLRAGIENRIKEAVPAIHAVEMA